MSVDIQALLNQQAQFFDQFLNRFANLGIPQSVKAQDENVSQSTMDSLAATMCEFVYDPDNNLTFEDWYERFEDAFLVDGVSLDEAAKVRLLLRKLETSVHTKYRNYILPRHPRDVTFADTVTTLKKIFGQKKSIFNTRYNCLKLVKQPHVDFISYASAVNKECEAFNFANLTVDQFKCLIFICGLQANDAEFRTRLLNKLEKDSATITLTMLTDECDHLTNLKKDSALIEASQRNQTFGNTSAVHKITNEKHKPSHKSSTKPSTSKKSPKYPCWLCGDMHFTYDCKYRTIKCKQCNEIGHKEGFCSSARDRPPAAPKTTSKKPRWFQHKHSSARTNSVFLVSRVDYASQRKFVTVTLNDSPINLQVDTASDISIISEATWQELGSPHGTVPDHSAHNASGGELNLKLQFPARIQFNGVTTTATCYVSSIIGLNLLGIDWINLFGLWSVPLNAVCNALTLQKDLPTNSTTNHASIAAELRDAYPEVFEKSLGLCTQTKATLHIKPNSKAVFRPKRPVPYASLHLVDEELARLEKNGVISRVNYSSWATPMVAIKKSNGTIRICGDYSTGLNDALESHQYPLPLPEEIFTVLTGGTLFSKIDFADAYLQIQVDEESKQLLTINTHRGLFQYNRLPFGVKPAPGIFQQIVDTMLAGLKGVVSYLDDLIVVGRTNDEHKANLTAVFDRIKEWGLHIREEKCEFCLPEVHYLGFIIDRHGRRPDPSKTAVICTMPEPKNISTLRSFLGMLSYYGQFISEMRRLRAPMDRLLTKDAKWTWNAECQKSFDRAKVILQSNLLLTHYDPRLDIKVAADASKDGIGAVILHRFPDGTEKAIAHAARSLTSAEQNYAQVEKEALALIFAVKKFHKMIYGRKFTLCTDHKPLLAIFGTRKGIAVYSASRLQRWALTLLAYDFDIEYVGTTKFGHADVLSRLISEQRQDKESCIVATINSTEADVQHVLFEASRALPVNAHMIHNATDADFVLSSVKRFLRTSWPASISDNIKTLYNRRESLSEIQGCLMYCERIIIPFVLQKKMLSQLHSGHPGIVKMKALARSYVYWPNIDADITQYVRGCANCAIAAKAPLKTTLSSWPIPSKPWSRIHMDFAGPYMGLNFLVIVDALSKWPEIFILQNITTSATIEKLRETFGRFGVPDVIVTDNGTSFTSHDFEVYCKSIGIRHIRTAPFHPQSNGQAERFVDSFKRALLKAKGEHLTAIALQTFLHAYRITPSEVLPNHQSPAEIMFGRPLRTVFDLVRPSDQQTTHRNDSMENTFNKQHGAVKREYKSNDIVYVMDYRNPKRCWIAATVLERRGKVMYTVYTSARQIWRRHANQIRSRKENNDILPNTYNPLLDMFDIVIPENKITPLDPNNESLQNHDDYSDASMEVDEPSEQSSSAQHTPQPVRHYPRRIRRAPKRLDMNRVVGGKYMFVTP